ncbi:MAG: adenosine deaminase [Acidobacteria bacterium]|jgi:adenosine deaminase|nr:adenosine deaminase [Acidobacteriota bacterium]
MKKGENIYLTREEIRELPKIELHVHLDCCLSFEVVSRINPLITREIYENEFIAPARCRDLADFLKCTHSSIRLMQTSRNLRMVTEDLFRQFREDNVIYAEIRFAPLQHLNEGLTPEQVTSVVEKTVSCMVEETGIEARVILCTLRHFTGEQSLKTAELVEDFRGTRVVGMDLAADEAGFPLDAHLKAFEYANSRFLPCTAHAGEAKGPESVAETLDLLKTSRIGHGVRSIENSKLVKNLKKKGIHLEICPACNIQTGVYDSYEKHPIDRLYRQGISLGINTDGRAITNITLSEEYERLQEVFGWGKEHFLTCNRHALTAAFLPDSLKVRLMEKRLNSL